MTPRVSAIVPCYNQAQYLPDALASVLAQTFQDWECIIVNDGSPDNTAGVAREWLARDSRFRYIEKPNGGLSSARNRGLQEATGEYVHFLDSDDYVAPGFYSAMVRGLESEPAACLAFTGWSLVDSVGDVLTSDQVVNPDYDWYHFMLQRCLCPCHAIVCKKELFDLVGNFDESLRSCEDWDMWLRIAATGRDLVQVEGHFVYYRQHGQSMTTNYTRMLDCGLGVIRKYGAAHGSCEKCVESLDIGELNLLNYIWNLTQESRMNRLLNEGRIFDYLGRATSFLKVDRRWFIRSINTLWSGRRRVSIALARRAGLLARPSK
jgi:glycosyltransferase involved in cell wall biosynthesis